MNHKNYLKVSRTHWFLVLAMILMFTLLPLAGKAIGQEEYPTKTITILCGYSPGGSTDRQARLIIPFLGKYLGKSVMIENLTGANGILATNKLFTSPPDGYTLLVASIPPIIIQELYLPETSRYQTRALTHAFSISREESVLLSNPELWKNLDEFLKAARSKRLRVGIPGKGTDSHLRLVMLEEMAGVKFNLIPFEGGAPAYAALAGKHLDGAVGIVSSTYNMVKSGMLNSLLVLSERRDRRLPQTPFPEEVGFKGFDPILYVTGIFGPPKLSPARVKVLEDAFAKAFKDQEFLALAKKADVELYPMNSRDFLATTEKEFPQVERIIGILKYRTD